jgi:hypothetical protein
MSDSRVGVETIQHDEFETQRITIADLGIYRGLTELSCASLLFFLSNGVEKWTPQILAQALFGNQLSPVVERSVHHGLLRFCALKAFLERVEYLGTICG